MKRIAVLITVHNRKELSITCLERIFAQTSLQDYFLDVYLTDDGSSDNTTEEVLRRYPKVQIIQGDGSLFWNRGMHRAWEEASKSNYDFYFWINDDTYLFEDSLYRLISISRDYHDEAIIAGSTCSKKDVNHVTYGGLNGTSLITQLTEPQECDTFNGNIVFIPKSVYLKIGMNDYHYRHSLGDTDYGLTATRNGIKCIIGDGIFGLCDLHLKPKVWMDPSICISTRFKNFISPLGNNPFEFFYYKRKNYGLFPAICSFISNWIHFFFPRFWVPKYNNRIGYQ